MTNLSVANKGEDVTISYFRYFSLEKSSGSSA